MRGRTTKPREGQTVNSTYILKNAHTPTSSAWLFERSASENGWWGVRFVVKLWVPGAEWRALSSSSRNTVTWMFVRLRLVITWSSPLSASAAADAWRSSEPWSWRWRWQSSRPWPAPPSRTPKTASSHPGHQNKGTLAIKYYHTSIP